MTMAVLSKKMFTYKYMYFRKIYELIPQSTEIHIKICNLNKQTPYLLGSSASWLSQSEEPSQLKLCLNDWQQ